MIGHSVGSFRLRSLALIPACGYFGHRWGRFPFCGMAFGGVNAPGTSVPTLAGPASCGITGRTSARPATGHEPVNLGVGLSEVYELSGFTGGGPSAFPRSREVRLKVVADLSRTHNPFR